MEPHLPEAKLVFAVQPSNVLAGASITPGVEVLVEDPFGNVVSSAADQMTLSLATGSTGAVLGGTAAGTTASGEATSEIGRSRPSAAATR